ncbi:DUF6597 domain-containing transcriptional factor [Streptomyces sp. NPDC023327]|uniref:DUF6597 domain-containing transcriptional factor n=1 Tax=Streptomyces sp. NPDC023327 TaxID=3157088 RepID=UPI0033DCE593
MTHGTGAQGEYRERPSRLPGAAMWTRTPAPGPGATRPVLPDGCMDLMWTEGRLFVAGPDTRAHLPGAAGTAGRHVGIRFHPGTAPALLGVPAHELRDRRVDLADLWTATRVRRLTARVDSARDPVAALEDLALDRAADTGPPDPFRALPAFGYGPKTLARVLRLQRALALVRAGLPYAATATAAGFADQAHLARDVKELTGRSLTALLGAP